MAIKAKGSANYGPLCKQISHGKPDKLHGHDSYPRPRQSKSVIHQVNPYKYTKCFFDIKSQQENVQLGVFHNRRASRHSLQTWKKDAAVVLRCSAGRRSSTSSSERVMNWSSGLVIRCRSLCLTITDKTMNISRSEQQILKC